MAVKPLPVHGVDISHHQSGSLDLAGARKRGLRWLYHKATEGDTYTDPMYARRRAEAAEAGLPFGAYHFARAEKGDALAEARRFIKVAAPKPGDLRPALDLETTEGLSVADLRIWAKTFVDEVERLVGVRPVVYTPYDLSTAVKGCLLWRPRYNNTNTPPVLPYDIWQFSNGAYGVPHTFEGIGNVDLNVMRDGLKVADMRIPQEKPAPRPKPTQRVHFMEVAMQFGDSDAQHTSDVTRIFERAQKRGVSIVLGTEAGTGSGNLNDELRRIAPLFGYRIWCPGGQKRLSPAEGGTTDCWIAVDRDFITGNWEQGFDPVIPGSRTLYKEAGAANVDQYPRWGTKGLVRVAFDSPLGRIHIGAGHYLTQARHPNAVVKGIDHWAWNEKFGQHISQWAVANGKGSALVFYGGDQNMADSKNEQPQGDSFFGGPLTSAADELENWQNTGHGPIDVIASYDRDGRVTAAYWRVRDDTEFALNTDHFLCEAGYDIRVL